MTRELSHESQPTTLEQHFSGGGRPTIASEFTHHLLSPIHTSNNVEATGNFVEAIFDFFAKNVNSVEQVI